MPRPRTGSTYTKDGIRQVAVTISRPGEPVVRWVRPCPARPDGTPMSETEGKLVALDLQRKFDRGEWDPRTVAPTNTTTAPETFSAWSTRWLAERERRGLRAVKDDRGRITNHVLPLLGDKAVVSIVRADVEAVVTRLDNLVRDGALSSKTAHNVWGLVSRAFADACSSKNASLRVRTDNPALGVAPPDRTHARARAYLHPSELLALLSCERVPVRWRELFALAVYTYARRGELEALTWQDVDLERGVLHIHSATDRGTGEVRQTKTGNSRRVPIESSLAPMLRRMRPRNGAGPIIPRMPPAEDLAAFMRTCLGYAGVTRAELYADDRTRAPITFHDLRATGITWMAVRGDDALKIQRRAGHTTLSTTQRYIREAEVLHADAAAVFPALPECLGGSATGSATNPPTVEVFVLDSEGNEWRSQRDLNPSKPSRADTNRNETAGFSTSNVTVRGGSDRLATGSATDVAQPDGPSPYAGEASLWAWFDRAELAGLGRDGEVDA